MTVQWKQDPGHGGVDPGAVAKGNTEKVYTLEAALYVNKRLSEHGIESECTRYMDQTLDETPRVASVKTAKKCISHHYNAGGGTGAEFIHSIYSDGKFEHLIAEEFKAAGYPVRRVFCRKGTSGDYYYMHRRTGAARVTIVEYDFVDGANSEKIKEQSYREGMYECVVKAICRDEGIAYKPLTKVVTQSTNPSIIYQAHIESVGWQESKKDGQTAGTTGQSKRLEALTVRLANSDAILEMEAHIEGKGWTTARTNGEIVGTIGEALRLEAIKIKCNKHTVSYRVHVQGIGWTSWKKNGEIAGTVGEKKRIEAIEIKLG